MSRPRTPFPLLASLRHRVQLATLLLTLAIGLQFYLYVQQAADGGPITIQRPAGVEGFLPIGALLGWKQLLTTGIWDPVHPAAMVILLYAALLSWAFRKAFCSWFCPVGTVSEWCWKLGHRVLGKNVRLPAALDWPLRALKYILLGFFLYATFNMATAQIASFLSSPYYKLADVKMLRFFTHIGTTALIVVVVLVLFSFIIRNFWCRYLCPYGALMGIFSLCSPTAIRRRPEACTNCLQCSRVCPSHLPVHAKLRVNSPECSGCIDCVETCPAAGALALETTGVDTGLWKASRLALAIGALFFAMVFVAQISGHWKSGIGETEFQMLLKMIEAPMFTHPSF